MNADARLDLGFIQNKTFDELKIGDTASRLRVLQPEDIRVFAAVSGDLNPAHLDADYASSDRYHGIVAHGMWGASLISAVLGTELPGPGTIYVSQSLQFTRPIRVGERVTTTVRVRDKRQEGSRVVLDCECVDQSGQILISGAAEVIAPTEKVRCPRALLPKLELQEPSRHFARLLHAARPLQPIRMAVVHPCDENSLSGVLGGRDAGLITPVLVGPRSKIEAAAQAAGLSLEGLQLIDAPHSHAAAAQAVALARAGQVAALMKGSLHTEEIMTEAVKQETGLQTERRMSHVYALDVPHYHKPLFITDAAINITPNLEEKCDIVQNAIDLCRALGIERPKVAVLSAVETVSSKLKSTTDAAALCKMAERGQIMGGTLDGPLGFDNAISNQAASTKHIVSSVAGDADVLIVPDLESGNMLAKQLIYLAGAQAAGLVLGARVPIVLTSRADGAAARTASCALAQIFVHWRSAKG
jgi:phosphotransacetylase/acyl dehydratase